MEPELKKRLYRALAVHDCTLKDWFLENADRLCEETEQPLLEGLATTAVGIGRKNLTNSKRI